ncbi:hypothetical protein SASPL_149923 [Salvia splendens]|uniref:Uncharacterized protein n=1 Tax=Salvia splendens TaxID=180675 RepID=A0A8X8W5I6_SALSN|nr:hypothetical protein SASPL_149923 [Salvia splendens]
MNECGVDMVEADDELGGGAYIVAAFIGEEQRVAGGEGRERWRCGASAEKRGAREGAPEQPGGGVADFDASSAATPSPVPRSPWHSPVPDNCDALQR